MRFLFIMIFLCSLSACSSAPEPAAISGKSIAIDGRLFGPASSPIVPRNPNDPHWYHKAYELKVGTMLEYDPLIDFYYYLHHSNRVELTGTEKHVVQLQLYLEKHGLSSPLIQHFNKDRHYVQVDFYQDND